MGAGKGKMWMIRGLHAIQLCSQDGSGISDGSTQRMTPALFRGVGMPSLKAFHVYHASPRLGLLGPGTHS